MSNIQTKIHSNVGIEGGYMGVYKKDEATNSFKLVKRGRSIELKEVRNVIETGEEKLFIVFCSDPLKGIFKDKEIPRNYLHKKYFGELLNIGIDAQDYNADLILMLLQNQELTTAKRVNVHTGLGFANTKDPITGIETLIFKAYKTIGGIDSTYAGKLKIEPQGDYNKWLDMIKTEVIGRAPLEMGLVTGAAAPVKSYLREETGDESTTVNLYGNSSCGKTTTGMLAVSVAGFPHTEGLMSTWNSTPNALEGILNGNFGFPILIDEASVSNDNGKKSGNPDYSKILYVIYGGVGKNRLNKDSSLKVPFKWSTVIVSTGEESLLSASNQNTGLRVRLIEFHVDKWTEDARQSNAIKQCVRENYGFAAPIIAEYLMSVPKTDLLNRLEELKQLYIASTTIKDEFTDRVAATYSLFLLTVEVLNAALGIEIEMQRILDFIVENERENYVEKDIGKRAYDYLLQTIAMHPEKFGFEDKFTENMYDGYSNIKKAGFVSKDPSNEAWGKIVYLKESESLKLKSAGKILTNEKIVIAEDKFEKILMEGRFSNSTVILKKWKAEGLLDCEADRLYRKQKITTDSATIKTYVVLVAKPEEEIKELERKISMAALKSSRRPKPIPIKSFDEIQDIDNQCANGGTA